MKNYWNIIRKIIFNNKIFIIYYHKNIKNVKKIKNIKKFYFHKFFKKL